MPPPTKKTSMAGPPPYTITCQPRPEEPTPPYSMDNSSTPQPAGWSIPRPTYNPADPPTPVHINSNVVIHQQPTSASVVYMAQQPRVLITGLGVLPKHPTFVTCNTCRNIGNTTVDYKIKAGAHIWSLCLCLWGFWVCGFCLLPYCMRSCKSAEHHCSTCGAYMGSSY